MPDQVLGRPPSQLAMGPSGVSAMSLRSNPKHGLIRFENAEEIGGNVFSSVK